jgi:hypothetical protein
MGCGWRGVQLRSSCYSAGMYGSVIQPLDSPWHLPCLLIVALGPQISGNSAPAAAMSSSHISGQRVRELFANVKNLVLVIAAGAHPLSAALVRTTSRTHTAHATSGWDHDREHGRRCRRCIGWRQSKGPCWQHGHTAGNGPSVWGAPMMMLQLH